MDAQNLSGQTPLHIACQVQNEDIVVMLTEAYADVNLGDVSGDAPIHLATKVRFCPMRFMKVQSFYGFSRFKVFFKVFLQV